SPLAGEGTMVGPRTRMGEGLLCNQHPSPIIARGKIEPPSPARGEGTIMATVLALRSRTNSLPPSRGACLRPGFASLLHSPRIEGWAERRETFGCSAEHP